MPQLVLLAHNIRSLWNIGSFFRTADAFGVSHIYLTGYTAAPPRYEISKTALGAEAWIPWTKETDPQKVIEQLKKDGYEIIALEIAEGSIPLSEYVCNKKTCLIVGHEVLGVSKELLALSDHSVSIPMSGKKESLNVSVALGIALYSLTSAKQ